MKNLYLLVIMIGISILSCSQNIEEEKENIKKVFKWLMLKVCKMKVMQIKLNLEFTPILTCLELIEEILCGNIPLPIGKLNQFRDEKMENYH